VKENGRVIRVKLTTPSLPEDLSLNIDGNSVSGTLINTGVPHFVVFTDNIDRVKVVEEGRKIRFHERFKPRGTNVNFAQVVGDGSLKIRTYERGVESETLACGTGATACALIAWTKGLIRSKPVEVKTRGGEVLWVDFDPEGREVFLEGRTVRVFDGFLSEEIFS
jgi:diaminopimelate epimerase